MKLIQNGKLWQTAGDAEEAHIPKEAGFFWQPSCMRWETGDISQAILLRRYADRSTRRLLDADQSEATAQEAASWATESNMIIPCPKGLSYLPFQKAGIAYASTRKETLIADEPGLGKTIQALGLANLLLSARRDKIRILIVGPKISLLNWVRETNKWLIKPLTIAIWTTGVQKPADVVLINYEIAHKPIINESLSKIDWDLGIFDESHNLKTPEAKKTKSLLGGKDYASIRCSRRLFMTGTPILNRPIELFTILNTLSLVKGFYPYARRYCNGHNAYGKFDVSGASNLDELKHLLRRTIMVRRLKVDVLQDLPPKRYAIVELEVEGAPMRAALAAEKKAAVRKDALISQRKMALAAVKQVKAEGGDAAELRGQIARLRDGLKIAVAEMTKVRHDTAVIKIPQVVNHVVAFLQGGEESCLIMAHHKDVIAGLKAGIEQAHYPCAVIAGSTSSADREQAQTDIQTGKKRVFIGSMHACGVAITLTSASVVMFAEQDWTPGVMTQAEDRAHRIGQKGSVLVQHLVIDGSFDCTMAKMVAAKSVIIDAVLDRIEPKQLAEARLVEAAADERELHSIEKATKHKIRRARMAESQAKKAARLFEQDLGSIKVTGLSVDTMLREEKIAATLVAEALGLRTAAKPDPIIVARGSEIIEMPDVPAVAKDDVVVATPAKRRAGRPKRDVTVSLADRRAKSAAAAGLKSIDLPGDTITRLRVARDARGLTMPELLSRALAALEREEATNNLGQR